MSMQQFRTILTALWVVLLTIDLYFGLVVMVHGLPHFYEAAGSGDGTLTIRRVPAEYSAFDLTCLIALAVAHVVGLIGVVRFWGRVRRA